MLFLLYGALLLVMVAAEAYGQTVLPMGYQILQQHSDQPLSNLNYYGQVQGYQMQPPNSQQYAFHTGQIHPSGNVERPRPILPIYQQGYPYRPYPSTYDNLYQSGMKPQSKITKLNY